MRGAGVLALVGVVLLMAACGGRPAASGTGSRASWQTPSARAPSGRAAGAAPSRLRLSPGETFTATVTFDEQDWGALVDELRFTARERFSVLRVADGAGTLQVAVTAWSWQRNTSALLTTSLPGTTTFAVNATGEILSGVDWPLPSELPLPGLDVFAAPLGPAGGWSRTDGEGVEVAYGLQASPTPGEVALGWSVARPQFTRSGDPVTVDGRAMVSVVSRYGGRSATVFLRSTREQASFERTTQSPAGTTQESGTVLETTTFSGPFPGNPVLQPAR